MKSLALELMGVTRLPQAPWSNVADLRAARAFTARKAEHLKDNNSPNFNSSPHSPACPAVELHGTEQRVNLGPKRLCTGTDSGIPARRKLFILLQDAGSIDTELYITSSLYVRCLGCVCHGHLHTTSRKQPSWSGADRGTAVHKPTRQLHIFCLLGVVLGVAGDCTIPWSAKTM